MGGGAKTAAMADERRAGHGDGCRWGKRQRQKERDPGAEAKGFAHICGVSFGGLVAVM